MLMVAGHGFHESVLHRGLTPFHRNFVNEIHKCEAEAKVCLRVEEVHEDSGVKVEEKRDRNYGR